jgi:hypothetical protein
MVRKPWHLPCLSLSFIINKNMEGKKKKKHLHGEKAMAFTLPLSLSLLDCFEK